jgi:DNA-binding NtrC family response regulator
MPPELGENTPNFHGLAGRSPGMRQFILQLQRMAPHLTLATLEGEEGTGKSLAARALHAGGPFASGPFVPCLASHFFTPQEGGSTVGWSAEILSQANHGMLLLDSVHQLSAVQQDSLAEFLHWFDDRQFAAHQGVAAGEPGHTSSVPARAEGHIPAQIVFSSSVPLRQPEAPTFFREDLASRLCGVRFRLPPLSERREDIPLLAQIFIQRFARTYNKPVRGLGPGTIAPLLRYAWPGNVQELENVITAAAVETESQWIRPIDLPPLPAGSRHNVHEIAGSAVEPGQPGPDSDLNLDRAIRSHVTRVLSRTRGNKLRAAQLLGISRSTLYRILASEHSIAS